MDFEEAFKVVDAAVFAKTKKHLKDIEVAILRGSWQGRKYYEIAETYGYTPEYLKHDVGPKLWKLLSEALGEKVSKTNFQAALKRQGRFDCTDATPKQLETVVQPLECIPSYSELKVLAIHFGCPIGSLLNHDLRGYLQEIEPYEWRSPQDTPTVVQAVLNLLAKGKASVPDKTGTALPTISPALTSIDERPLPAASPELPVGQVPLDSGCYVERPPIEDRCYQEILQPGALIQIKAPRQMGKTSLMARILYQARNHGYQTVSLSFQLADRAVFSNLDTFLRWFCESVGRRLQRLNQLDDYWTTYGSKNKATAYFEECLLEEIAPPLVIGLDQVDRVFPHSDIADDFFSLLRAWYEYAKYGDRVSEMWKKLRVVMVHSSEVYIPLDINQSPLSVGLNVELQDFSPQQVQDLVGRHDRLNWITAQVEKLMNMVGGHPYLVRLALYHIQYQDITLEQLLQTAPKEAGIYSDHLRRHLCNLKQHPDLAAAFRRVVTTLAPVELDSESAFKLHSMGLVVHRHENNVTVRCDLYRRYFRDRLS